MPTQRHLSAARCLTVVLAVCLLSGCLTNPNSPPVLLQGDALRFPEAARRDGVEGAVRLRYDVDSEGRVRNAQVLDGTPAGVFDEAALAAVRSWRFRPARRNGQPVAVQGMTSTLQFTHGERNDYPSR